ncbi:MAG: hypothetical protein ACKOEO_22025 [Planctomycetaceae bacterium]
MNEGRNIELGGDSEPGGMCKANPFAAGKKVKQARAERQHRCQIAQMFHHHNSPVACLFC